LVKVQASFRLPELSYPPKTIILLLAVSQTEEWDSRAEGVEPEGESWYQAHEPEELLKVQTSFLRL
jgi:hypothetical protein